MTGFIDFAQDPTIRHGLPAIPLLRSIKYLSSITMRTLTIGLLLSSLIVSASACHSDQDDDAPAPSPARRLIEQIPPPLDLKTPPADATKTASGLVFTKLAIHETGAQPRLGDTALVHYTGWRQRTGDT